MRFFCRGQQNLSFEKAKIWKLRSFPLRLDQRGRQIGCTVGVRQYLGSGPGYTTPSSIIDSGKKICYCFLVRFCLPAKSSWFWSRRRH
ncbi:hypothetical protein LINPERPRIM_LOCUS1273 [Linum perenne]